MLHTITLSNTDHKLITKTFSRKLTAAVGKLISPEQTTYIPNRLINDKVRSMLITMDLANSDELVDGVIVSLDAKKAFDSVDHNYIRRCLEAFGLTRFIPIFNILYKDLKSDIIFNGKVVNGYKILRGVKQGDALSCIIFVMCMEPLIRNIKLNPRIERISSSLLNIEIPKVYGYADDINAVTKNSQACVQELFNEYEELTRNSGLMLNAEKTEVLRFKTAGCYQKTFQVKYMESEYSLTTVTQAKINGILFFQSPAIREDRNVAKVIEAMTRHLDNWSRRRLTLLGKIVILKTFAISQMVYLMQSLMLHDDNLKRLNNLMFKFLWNKNFALRKAPDRIKRTIMLTRVKYGGFGMLDIFLLNKWLNLKSLGRMKRTDHPLLKQCWQHLKAKEYFNVTCELRFDDKLTYALKLLNEQRETIKSWPVDKVVSDPNLLNMLNKYKLKNLLTRVGRLSIPVFRVLRGRNNLLIEDLTEAELSSVERYLKDPDLRNILNRVVRMRVQIQQSIPVHDMFPTNGYLVKNLSKIKSQDLRHIYLNTEDSMICIYKSGLILAPGEVTHWTAKIRKLTSTKHKCAILRVAHGDIYTNHRLFRFGLTNDPKCLNCDNPVETLSHRIFECNLANEAWTKMEDLITAMDLQPMMHISLEGILGIEPFTNKLELTLRAELLSRLIGKCSGPYSPTGMVKACLSTVRIVVNLVIATRQKIESIINTF